MMIPGAPESPSGTMYVTVNIYQGRPNFLRHWALGPYQVEFLDA